MKKKDDFSLCPDLGAVRRRSGARSPSAPPRNEKERRQPPKQRGNVDESTN